MKTTHDNKPGIWAVIFVILALSPCTGSAKDYVISDTFNMGNGIVVRAIEMDPKTVTMWVGTSIGALEIDLRTLANKATYTRANSGLANEYVFDIFVDSHGKKWFGTDGGGIASLSGKGEWETFMPMHGLADYWVYAFTEQKDGSIWMGTWAGANLFKPETKAFSTYMDELINIWVYGMDTDSKDRVWLGTEGGVSMFDGKTWSEWDHEDGMGAPNTDGLAPSKNTGLGTRDRHDLSAMREGRHTYNPNYVFDLMVDSKDQVWVGTWGAGISMFDGTKWKNYTVKDGLAGDVVYSLAQDRNGVYWFGTIGGLSSFDGKNWKNYTKKDGLPGNSVYTIATTTYGDIWVGTTGGVARLNNK